MTTAKQEAAVGTEVQKELPQTPEPLAIEIGETDARRDEPDAIRNKTEARPGETAKDNDEFGKDASDCVLDGDRAEFENPDGDNNEFGNDGSNRVLDGEIEAISLSSEDSTGENDRHGKKLGAAESDAESDAAEIVLEAVGLTKIYRRGFGAKKSEVVALKNVGFAVRAGEVVGFLGPNGAGKSTAIKLVTGLASMSAGSVKILGRDVKTDRKAALAAVGGVIEQPDLYADMTAVDLMRYFASLYPDEAFRDAEGISSKEKKENRIGSLLKLVGLESRKNDKIRTYSLGMKQRLGIAQALTNKPRLLLLDEPANGLDPAGIKDVRDIVKRLAHELGMAVLVSSHQLQEMQQMCDRVVILYRGQKVAEGTLRELLKNVSKRKIRVRTSEPKRAAECFKETEGVAAIAEAGGILLSGEISAGDAAKTLVLAGVPFTGIAEDAATLEEFFFRMTKEEPER